eukprot:COSAG05_NODE_13667_length_422_cov_0.597523_1_plen_106_part_01
MQQSVIQHQSSLEELRGSHEKAMGAAHAAHMSAQEQSRLEQEQAVGHAEAEAAALAQLAEQGTFNLARTHQDLEVAKSEIDQMRQDLTQRVVGSENAESEASGLRA